MLHMLKKKPSKSQLLTSQTINEAVESNEQFASRLKSAIKLFEKSNIKGNKYGEYQVAV